MSAYTDRSTSDGGIAADDRHPRREGERPVTLATAIAAALGREADRWFLWTPVLFAIGIGLYFALPAEPDLLPAAMPAVAALLAWPLWRSGLFGPLLMASLVAITGGLAAAKLRADWVRAPTLAFELRDARFSGFVEQIEPRPDRGPRVTFLVTRIEGIAPDDQPLRVRVRMLKPVPDVALGDHLKLRATLAPPPRPALPGGFDFARAAYFLQIGATGYSLADPERVDAPGPMPVHVRLAVAVAEVRAAIGRRITAVLPGETGAIATALVTGERGGVPEDVIETYRDSGIVHILSISGLHMAIMAGSVFLVLRFLLAAFPVLALRQPIKKWAAGAAIVSAGLYLLISGGSLATIRSFVMITVMFAAILIDRPALALRNVALAALLILAIMPESLLNAGFQMSFAAVIALIATYEAVRDRATRRPAAAVASRGLFGSLLRFVGGIVATTLVASLAVTPIAAFHFHQAQQLAVLANLIAVPLTNLLVMPAALATLVLLPFGLEWWPLQAMAAGIDIMSRVAAAVAELPGSVSHIPAIPTPAVLLMLAGGLWLAIWRRRWRLWGLVAIVGGLALAPTGDRPAVLVGEDGLLVAYREPEGHLSVFGKRGKFLLSRWLEHDGDSRDPAAVMKSAAGRCDDDGCIARIDGQTLAVAWRPSALAQDCARAAILVAAFAPPASCRPALALIGGQAVRDHGPHAVFLGGHAPRVLSVDGSRGLRPWVVTPEASRAAREAYWQARRSDPNRPGAPSAPPNAPGPGVPGQVPD